MRDSAKAPANRVDANAKTVCGWTIIKLSRHCGHQRESSIQNQKRLLSC